MHAPELEDDSLHTLQDESAPERVSTSLAKNRSHVTDGSVGSSSGKRPLVAVTTRQKRIVVEALVFYRRPGVRHQWPTIEELADAVNMPINVVRREVSVLAMLGCVWWRKGVRVRQFPDGLFFVPKWDIGSRGAKPGAGSRCAPAQVAK